MLQPIMLQSSRMKLLPLLSFASWLVSAGPLLAQLRISGTSGYITVAVPGAASVDHPSEVPISFPFAGKIEAAGQMDASSGSTVTDNQVNFSAILGSVKPGGFYLQATNTASGGRIYLIQSASGTTLTLDGPAPELMPGTTYTIIRTSTLASVLPPVGTQLQTGATAATADVLVLWDAALQAQKRYFTFSNGAVTTEWRQENETFSANDTPLAPGRGAILLRRALAATNLLLTGRVTRPPQIMIHPGVNLVATPFLGCNFRTPVSSSHSQCRKRPRPVRRSLFQTSLRKITAGGHFISGM